MGPRFRITLQTAPPRTLAWRSRWSRLPAHGSFLAEKQMWAATAPDLPSRNTGDLG